MYGPVYLSREFSARFLPVLEAYYETPGTEQFYWEQPFVDMLKGEAKRRLEQKGERFLPAQKRLPAGSVSVGSDRDGCKPSA